MFALIALLLAGQSDSSIAIVGVNLVRADRPGIDRNRTVIIQGETITWVGPADRADPTRITRAIDGRGKYLLPGFADMHVHLGREGDLVTYLANGITTIRNMAGWPQLLDWRRRIAAGELLGPRIVSAGPILDGNPPSISSMTVLMDPSTARAEVTRQHEAGYDFVKIYNSLPKSVYDSVLLVAKELRLPVAGHVPFEVGLRGAFAAGQRSIEHLRGYIAELVPPGAPIQPGASLKSRSLAWNNIDDARIPELVRATVAAAIWNCPTLMVTDELLAPPDRWAELAARPILRYLGPDATGDRATVPYLRDFEAEDYREAGRGVAAQRRVVRAIDKAGGRLLAGTDSYLQGFALQTELEQLEASGLSRWSVLMVATVNAARYLDESDRWGTIAAGQRADLQLVDADPLTSLAALRKRSGVMVRGRWFPIAELERRLEGVARSDPAATRP